MVWIHKNTYGVCKWSRWNIGRLEQWHSRVSLQQTLAVQCSRSSHHLLELITFVILEHIQVRELEFTMTQTRCGMGRAVSPPVPAAPSTVLRGSIRSYPNQPGTTLSYVSVPTRMHSGMKILQWSSLNYTFSRYYSVWRQLVTSLLLLHTLVCAYLHTYMHTYVCTVKIFDCKDYTSCRCLFRSLDMADCSCHSCMSMGYLNVHYSKSFISLNVSM